MKRYLIQNYFLLVGLRSYYHSEKMQLSSSSEQWSLKFSEKKLMMSGWL